MEVISIEELKITKNDGYKAIAWLSKVLETLTDDKQYIITIDKKKQKRSLNANAYCWLLIGKIADKLRLSKDEVYLSMLKSYGQSEIISVLAEVPILQYLKYCEEIGETTLNGKLFKHYKVYKGSSEYTTREMAVLIDGVVSEANELDISTLTPSELAHIKSMWKG